ncbi:unnamed protein product [Bursaphelenchus okinawaensis]|uniref:Uncharacterized protein n=1 Tax=Bursaphelenchus okinawaensis TaxID=465554 RepID=A0A811LN36_9BILA|nr:unnamed protein product [Bursaphelenchus okinawaensis]CAG9125710.1 unnamed protein product [Bursaphelenchus okinawaensis]
MSRRNSSQRHAPCNIGKQLRKAHGAANVLSRSIRKNKSGAETGQSATIASEGTAMGCRFETAAGQKMVIATEMCFRRHHTRFDLHSAKTGSRR